MKAFPALLLAAAVALCSSAAPAGGDDFTFYLVRHAEKALDGSADPGLTEQGQARAERLARWLEGRGLEAVWSSDYRRTRQTVQPTAERLGLPIRTYDPGAQEAFAATLLAARHTALVAGHSNTLPELARKLCGCAVPDIPDTDYERLFVIRVGPDGIGFRNLDQSGIMPQR